MAEGETKARRANILRALQLRFTSPIPTDLTSALGTITDHGELARWFDVALTASSLEEFRAAVEA
jgi:hypothetical protein